MHPRLALPAAILLLTTLIDAAGPAPAQAFDLGLRVDVPVYLSPYSVAIGDLTGDGRPDLAVAHVNNNLVSIQLSNGTGAFTTGPGYASGITPNQVVIADLNGDGRGDLVDVNLNSKSVSYSFNNGAGGFLGRVDLGTNTAPRSVAVGDLNGDGRPDLVAANSGGDNVSVFLADGAGGFATRTDFATGAGPYAVVLGDVDGDGRLDAVTANQSEGSITVLLGNGTGGFPSKADFRTAAWPIAVAMGDFDADGALDLALLHSGANTASVMLGTGDGGFRDEVAYATGDVPQWVAVGDLDGDDMPDLAVANAAGNSVSVLTNDGFGGFGARADFSTGAVPMSVVIGDLNGDGKADLATANLNGNSLTVLFAKGAGGFGARSNFAAMSGVQAAAIADLDGDGHADVVTANMTSLYWFSTYLGNGSGGLSLRQDFNVGYANGASKVAIGDINTDGAPDVVLAGPFNTYWAYPGDGSGGWGPRISPAPIDPFSQSVAMADLNEDGNLDLIYSGWPSSLNITTALGTGTGLIGTPSGWPVVTGPGTSWMAAPGDLNGDGHVDIVAACSTPTTAYIAVLIGTGTGSFGVSVPYDMGGGTARHVAIGDLNLDGRADIVAVNQDASRVSVFLGTGGGVFGPRLDFATGSTPTWVSIGDLNLDGRPDLVVSNNGSQSVSVLLGDGVGGFAVRADVPTPAGPICALIADMNEDGIPDLVTANNGASTVSIIPGLARTRLSLAVGPNPTLHMGPLTLTATLTYPATTLPAPSGTVRFFDGTQFIGSATVSGGVATTTTYAYYRGPRIHTAVYSGDARYLGSVSQDVPGNVVTTAKPAIASIMDVKNDQGRQLRLRFRPSPLDFVGSGTPVVRYDVFRRVAPGLAAMAGARRDVAMAAARPANVQVDGWDFVATLSPYADTAYTVVVPTLADSSASGIHRAVFFVRAATATSYYDSPADSGYSVDNLPPAPPSGFTGAYALGRTQLQWNGGIEADLWYYRLYRGSSLGFIPGPANWVANVTQSAYADSAGGPYHYKLSAVDLNGNESGFAVVTPSGTAAIDLGGPLEFGLAGAVPNPGRAGRLSVSFALASDAEATLDLLDVSGRRVASRDVGTLGAGRHTVELGAGRRIAPGLYLVRLAQGAQMRVARVAVLD